ncbi:MAG: type IV pilus biogenesis/stability protein PilW [Gallionella sp.]|nr:type IV pilus biogenesis/stability protein PilW [Gallionella sp.]
MNILIVLLFLLAGLTGCGTPSGGADNAAASAKVHTELAGMYYEVGKYGVALEEIDLALQADRSYAPAYGVRGLVHMALREEKEAEEDFQKSLRLDSTDSDTHNNYGWFLCQRDRVKEAIPQFMAALKNPLYQTPERAYLNAGLCSKKAGQNKDAEEFLQRSLQIQPDLAQAWLGLAELSFANADYFSAKKYFTSFSERSGKLTAEQLWLAVRIARKNGDRNSESSYGMQLRKLFPDARETQMLIRGE